MNVDLIRAHLNLYAVLQNMEELVQLDASMGDLSREWDVSIQFTVLHGPAAYLEFAGGACRHGRGEHENPSIKLLFASPKHLNLMFEGSSAPIPLKGFTRLGFLQKDFVHLTERLAYYLKPEPGHIFEEGGKRINTVLTLYTAASGIKELAALDPACKEIAARIPPGVLQLEVPPDGLCACLDFGEDGITFAKSPAEQPMATLTFQDLEAAHAMLANEMDYYEAVTDGRLTLQGRLPMIEEASLILERVERYLRLTETEGA